jgi:hypothetical protein
MDRIMGLRSYWKAGVAVCSCLVACVGQQPMAGTTDETSGKDVSAAESAAGQTLDIDQQVSFAKQALAERLKVDSGIIEVDTVRTVHWRSGATGCPRPGMSYTMAIVPGVQILLKVDGEAHRYHARVGREPFFCPAAQAEAPVFGQGEEAM